VRAADSCTLTQNETAGGKSQVVTKVPLVRVSRDNTLVRERNTGSNPAVPRLSDKEPNRDTAQCGLCQTLAIQTMKYNYDYLGNVTGLTDAIGNKLTYTYNAAAQLTAVTTSLSDATHPGSLLSAAEYNPFGNRVSATLGGQGALRNVHFDNRGRLLEKETDLATCDLSRRCTCGTGTADRWSVAETTMGAGEVVMLQPRLQMLIAFLGVVPMANVGPFAEHGLDEAFGFAVGAGSIGTSEAVANAELGAVVAKLVRAIATTVVGQQAANTNAVLGIKSDGVLEESDGGGGLLIGQQLGKGEPGVIIDGDMESLPAANWRRPRRRPSPRIETC
jgi:YD repeat-containing protein